MKTVLTALAAFALSTTFATAAEVDPADWDTVLKDAKGETVYWNAWGGSQNINAYIGWVGEELQQRFGVKLVHVKLDDTANAVATVVTEKAAGKDIGGTIDLIWINGENFAAMKKHGLLFGPWAERLPNWAHVDVAGKPGVVSDFTVPTDGLEAPWGMAQLVFYYDSARLAEPPRSMAALAEYLESHPGRFAYPKPPDFLGSTFLKQALYELVDGPSILMEPAADPDFAAVTAPLWSFLDRLAPNLWRSGRAFPPNGTALRQLMADGEIDLALSFNPSEASSAIAGGELPDTVRTFVLDGGTIGNANFVAIPYNANAKAGAMVVADFLLSPKAQARKQDPKVWGAPTVLDVAALSPEDRARFDALALGPATLSPVELGPALPEPHPSWMVRIEQEWEARYGAGR